VLDAESVVKFPAAGVVDPIAGGAAKIVATKLSVANLLVVSPVACVVAVVPFGSAVNKAIVPEVVIVPPERKGW
jgi:hypothetical protein